jgi:hypothetical protein
VNDQIVTEAQHDPPGPALGAALALVADVVLAPLF